MSTEVNDEAPKYRQIVDAVVLLIKKEDLKAGDQIGSLNELADLWKVSKTTVQKAMDELSLRGFIERKTGSGTFVKRGKLAMWDPEEVSVILAGLDDFEPDTSQQVDMIVINVPGRPDQILIHEPSEIDSDLCGWPYLVTYFWPEVCNGNGDQMDRALFQEPEDVVDYVLKIIDRGGYSYKASEE